MNPYETPTNSPIVRFIRTPRGRFFYLIFAVLLGLYSVWGFVNLVHQRHTDLLEKDFVSVVEEWKKSPPGIQREERYLARLKALDTSYTPAEVKAALNAYISAYAAALIAVKEGRAVQANDVAIENAKQRLIAAVKRNE
jgi:hypothetical protein